jgi:cryptochrome
MWLSASQFFHKYFHVYSPVAFPKNYDKNGDYVRHFIPALRHMDSKYIYEPWKAPLNVQKAANCIIG